MKFCSKNEILVKNQNFGYIFTASAAYGKLFPTLTSTSSKPNFTFSMCLRRKDASWRAASSSLAALGTACAPCSDASSMDLAISCATSCSFVSKEAAWESRSRILSLLRVVKRNRYGRQKCDLSFLVVCQKSKFLLENQTMLVEKLKSFNLLVQNQN